jgi:hypothetical protein
VNEISFNLPLLAFLSATVIPILVGLLAKANASGGVKAILSVLLSAGAGLITVAIDGGGLLTQEMATAWFYAFVAAQAGHFGLLKPLKITGAGGAVPQATADVGIG